MTALELLKTHADEFAKKSKLTCEISEAGDRLHCIIGDVKLKSGKFNLPTTPLLFTTDQQYPASAMDMFWVDEKLTLADGTVAPASEEITELLGKRWRRFSRHRGPGAPPWDP